MSYKPTAGFFFFFLHKWNSADSCLIAASCVFSLGSTSVWHLSRELLKASLLSISITINHNLWRASTDSCRTLLGSFSFDVQLGTFSLQLVRLGRTMLTVAAMWVEKSESPIIPTKRENGDNLSREVKRKTRLKRKKEEGDAERGRSAEHRLKGVGVGCTWWAPNEQIMTASIL